MPHWGQARALIMKSARQLLSSNCRTVWFNPGGTKLFFLEAQTQLTLVTGNHETAVYASTDDFVQNFKKL